MKLLSCIAIVLSLLGVVSGAPADSSYKLVWSDEFNGADNSSPNSAVWTHEIGNNDGWGNSEVEYYTARTNNSYIHNGSLVIQALAESYEGYSYTSARITTESKVQFYLGFVEYRTRVTTMSNGMWPAAWLLGSKVNTDGWPQCGEIDIMEQVNGADTSVTPNDWTQYGTIHWNNDGINSSNWNHDSAGATVTATNAIWGDDYHVYGMEWTNTSIQFYVDGTEYGWFTLSQDNGYAGFNSFYDPNNPFFFIINLALGGSFPDQSPSASNMPTQFIVDYVRLYQKSNDGSYFNAPSATSASNTNSSTPLTSDTASNNSSSSVSLSLISIIAWSVIAAFFSF